MLRTEIKPSVLAVCVALSGATASERICRWMRCRVIFPDIGGSYVEEIGFLRYQGEKSFVVPEATEQELSLQPGLTIHL